VADNFGLKIGVEGEKEFKSALRDINQSFKVLGSEMKLVTSEFDKQDKSIAATAARNEVLNKAIDAQKDKISTLEAALRNASESFGENDRRTENWQIALNNANAELNNMERELEESAEEADDLGEELEDAGDSAEKSGGKFEKLGGILKGIGVAMGAVAVAAGAAAVKLGKEVISACGLRTTGRWRGYAVRGGVSVCSRVCRKCLQDRRYVRQRIYGNRHGLFGKSYPVPRRRYRKSSAGCGHGDYGYGR